MKINLKATGIELTPAISDYATRKISAIEKYLADPDSATAYVEVGKSTKHHKQGPYFRAEVRVSGNFYAKHEAEDLYAAIDLVRDEIAHELTHAKDKRLKLVRRGGRVIKNIMRRWS